MLWRAPVIRRDPSLASTGHPARPIAGDSRRQPRVVFGDQPPFELEVLLQSTAAFPQPLAPITRHRRGVGLAFGVERLLGLAQPLATIASHTELDRQLIAARVPCAASSAASRSAASSRISRAICS
jgi:hypothetical protein